MSAYRNRPCSCRLQAVNTGKETSRFSRGIKGLATKSLEERMTKVQNTRMLPWQGWYSAWHIRVAERVMASHDLHHTKHTFYVYFYAVASQNQDLLSHCRRMPHLSATSSGLKHGLPLCMAVMHKTLNVFAKLCIFLLGKWEILLSRLAGPNVSKAMFISSAVPGNTHHDGCGAHTSSWWHGTKMPSAAQHLQPAMPLPSCPKDVISSLLLPAYSGQLPVLGDHLGLLQYRPPTQTSPFLNSKKPQTRHVFTTLRP